MKFYNQQNRAIVGSYKPSDEWSKWTHFAVMDEETGGLITSCGYFQNLEEPTIWGFNDYKHAVECIEQAQLYANAVKMFNVLSRCAVTAMLQGTQIQEDAKNLIEEIEDISEAAKRLLGDDSMKIIDYVLSNKKSC